MIDKKIKEIEQLAKKLETSTNFDEVVKDFGAAATLIQKVLVDLKDASGKITEIIDGVEVAWTQSAPASEE